MSLAEDILGVFRGGGGASVSPRCNERYVQWCSYAISRTYALSGHRYLAKCFLFFAFPIFYRKDIFPGIKGNSFLQIMQD